MLTILKTNLSRSLSPALFENFVKTLQISPCLCAKRYMISAANKMGNNFSSIDHAGKGFLCGKSRRKGREKYPKDEKNIPMTTENNHGGIRTIKAENFLDLSTDSDICICVITWNMNGKVSYEDLAELVETNRQFDLIVVGLQEVPRRNVSLLLQKALAQSYVMIGEAAMQSLQLYVFGRKNSDLFIKEVKVDKHSVGGCGGVIGRKKGAVAIRINYKGINMLFISCHLSAHAHKVEERNSQCRHISHSLFSKNWNPYSTPTQITVWLGDLNYRLQGIANHPARNLIHKGLHKLLTYKDQLLQEAERGQIFDGYCEGTLTFKPTYKYNVGTSNYDTSYKVRVPSWTDRILFKIQDMDHIDVTLLSYESMDDIHSSDHKPVRAHLCLRYDKQS